MPKGSRDTGDVSDLSRVTKHNVERFFKKYVFGFVFGDIQREIGLARAGTGGGNLLAALGLLCYTEFMGGIATGKVGRGQSKRNFDAFFARLGPEYLALQKQVNVYDVFRCGIAHEYLVKRNCEVSMLKTTETCGIIEGRGRYYFNVEKYFEDFAAACRRLHSELMAQPVATQARGKATRPDRPAAAVPRRSESDVDD
jgi:hypothetical protein